jgi:Ca2+-binding EF-hand superfamily protein
MDMSYAQIERPLSRQDFAKLILKTLGLKLPAGVMDVLMVVFGDEQGRLDGTEFVQVMKRRNKVPGYKVRRCCCCCCGY